MKTIRICLLWMLALCLVPGAFAVSGAFVDSNGLRYESYDSDAASIYHSFDGEVYQYDAEGRLIQQGLGIPGVMFVYDLNDNLTPVSFQGKEYDEGVAYSYRGDLRTMFEYDAQGRIAQASTDTVLYDESDEIIAAQVWKAQPVYQADGTICFEWPNGSQTRYGYDGAGRLVQARKDVIYDAQGRLTGNGDDCSIAYADDGTMTLTWTDGRIMECTAEGWPVMERFMEDTHEYAYDASGRRTEHRTDSPYYKETTRYNENGLPLVIEVAYESEGVQRKEFDYWEDGLARKQCIDHGYQSISEFDRQGRILRASYEDGAWRQEYQYFDDGGYARKEFWEDDFLYIEYYANGLMKHREDGSGGYEEWNEEGFRTLYVYDSGIRLVYKYVVQNGLPMAMEEFYDVDGTLSEERIYEDIMILHQLYEQ